MPIIKPIDQYQQSRVLSETQHYINLADQIFNTNLVEIPVNFKLTGRAAGMYHVHCNKRLIRYNPYIFAKYFEDNLQNTVPHEVAHYVADIIYGIKNIRPHGREWQDIMIRFGVEPKKNCNYDLEGIPQRQHRRFQYHCQCRRYEITTRRHNMISRGERLYQCPACKSKITYTESA